MAIAQKASSSTVSPTESRAFQLDQVLTLSAGHLVHDVFTSFIAPWLPLIIEKLGLSLTMAGSLVAFQQLPSLVNPFLGMWADRHSLRWLAVLAPATTAAAITLAGLAPNYTGLMILLLVSGISTAAWHVLTPVMVARASGRRIGQGMSFYMLGGELAYTVGPLLAVGAVSLWTLEGAYRLIPLGLAATAILAWRTRDADVRPAGPANGSWAEALRELRPVILPIAGIIAAQGFMSSALNTFLPTLLSHEGASLWLAGGSISILEMAGAAGVVVSGTFSDRVGRRGILAVALVVSPALMLLFLAAQGPAMLVALFALGFVIFSPNPVLLALVQEYGRDHPSTANGTYMAISFAGRSLITIVIGALADRWGLRTTFQWCAIFGFSGLAFALLLPRRSRPVAESPELT